MKSVIAKPRPMNLVSHSLLSKRNSASQHLSDSNNLENAQVEQGVLQAALRN